MDILGESAFSAAHCRELRLRSERYVFARRRIEKMMMLQARTTLVAETLPAS